MGGSPAVRRLWILVMGVGPGAAKLRPREPFSERRGVACGAQQCCAPTRDCARAIAFRGPERGERVMAYRYPDSHVFYRKLGRDFPRIVRGDGCYLYDENGKRYLDAV